MALDRSGANDHRIGRARFEIAGENHDELLAFRAKLASAAEGSLPAALSLVFDRAAGPEEVLEIERLVVDLGVIEAGDLDVAAIAAAVGRAVERAASGVAAPRAERAGTPPAKDRPEDETREREETPARRSGAGAAALDALDAYLATGVLPATSPRRGLGDLVSLGSAAKADEAAAAMTALRARLAAPDGSGPPPALLRLIAAAPAQAVLALLERLFPGLSARAGGAAALRVAVDEAVGSEARLVQSAAAILALLKGEVEARPADVATKRAATPGPDPFRAERGDHDVVAIENAGVVLLHPFLPRLFALCDLTEDGRFADEPERVAGVRLIHYLATGETWAEEPSLALPRLLCACRPELPALSVEPLAEEWTERADALLHAAIRHWSKLGRTSPDALRETFLRRGGALSGPKARRRLRVEARGVDVLLGALPWALDPVRLPWLKAPIGVDWA